MSLLQLAISVNLAGLLVWLVYLGRHMNQLALDRSRKTYRLSFPADLTTDQTVEWVRAISGTLRGSKWRFKSVPTVAMEVFATQDGIKHRLKIPYGHSDYVVKQLRLKGINADPETKYEDRNWSKGVELRMTQPARQLHIASEADTSSSILVNFQSLAADEALMLQIVFTPAGVVTLPIHNETEPLEASTWQMITSGKPASKDEVSDRRDKLTEPNMLVAIRIVGHAAVESRAEKLVTDVCSSYAARRAPGTQFRTRKFVDISKLRDRVKQASTPDRFQIKLSASELAALSAWPFGGPFISGLAPSMTRHMPAVAAIPSDGRVLGTATFHGDQRPVAQPYKHAVRHTHVLGPNGVGKTVLLTNMIVQDMQRGYGVVLIETKGDLFHEVVARIPTSRLNDVVIVDVNDSEMPVGFNILDQGNNRTSIDEMSAIISDLYAESSRSIQAPQVLYHLLHALAEVPGHTFVDLHNLMANHASHEPGRLWQDSLVRQLKNREVSAFMQRYMNMSKPDRDRLAGPVINRTWEFVSRPEIRRIFGQRTSSFRMVDALQQNKIILINLNGGGVGQQTAMIAGTLFANAVWQAARQIKVEKANFLYLDEFQDIARFPIGLEAMLAKARGFNLGTVLAHQHTGQLTPNMRDAVMANTATKVVFQTTADDARIMARNFMVKDVDFMNLARYQTICKVATDTGMSPPVTVGTKPEPKITGNEAKARLFSRTAYGRPLEDVTRDIETLPGIGQPPESVTPKISGEEWF